MENPHRRGAQEGQALLLVLIALTLLSLIGAAMTALWARSFILVQRRADSTAALYAAEAGIAKAIQELAVAGGGGLLRREGTVGETPFQAAYVVEARPGGDGTYELVSTGRKGRTSRTVRVRISSPFLFPLYAGRSLHIVADDPLLGETRVVLSPAPGYGESATVHGDVTPKPEPRSLALPTIPFAPFAAAAGTLPSQLVPLPKQDGTLTNAWYAAGDCEWWRWLTTRTVTVPSGVVAGISGDMTCGNDSRLVVKSGATLVITGNLQTDRVEVEDNAKLIIGGHVDIDSVQLWGNLPAGGGGLIVAGGSVTMDRAALVAGSSRAEHTLAILALDRRGCAAAACGQDDASNNIYIEDVAVVDLNTPLNLLVYAAPLPGKAAPQVSLNFVRLVDVGLVTVNGSTVSAGDLSLEAKTTLAGATTWQFQADPEVLARLVSAAPQAGIWTQLRWDENTP